MGTTVAINDELLAAAKRRARARGESLGQVLETALRRELASPEEPPDVPSVPVFTDGTGPRPGIDLTSNRSLHEVLDEALDLNRRR